MTDMPDLARLLSELSDAGTAFADVMGRENAALAAHDTAASTALLGEKTLTAKAYSARLQSLREASCDFQDLSDDDRHFLDGITAQLAPLAAENAMRLKAAVEAGRRLMTAVAVAARAATPGPGTYSPSGAVSSDGRNRVAAQRSPAISLNRSL